MLSIFVFSFLNSRLASTIFSAIPLRDSLILNEAILLSVFPYTLSCFSNRLSTLSVILFWKLSYSSATFLWKLVKCETVRVMSHEYIATKIKKSGLTSIIGNVSEIKGIMNKFDDFN